MNGGEKHMNFRKMDANATADFAENIATLLGGTELSAIDSNVRTDLLTAIGTLPASLATAAADAMVARDEAIAATSVRDEIKIELDTILGQVAANLRAGLAPKAQFDLCGFDYPFGVRSRTVPNAPTDLSAFGTSNGLNTGKFTGNNRHGSVQYEIWRREGDEGEWMLLKTTTKQSFSDTPVTPGQYYEYKVRAIAATAVSAFSGSAVVYGVV
jgi:hypothetical protein